MTVIYLDAQSNTTSGPPKLIRIGAGQTELILSAGENDLRLMYYGLALRHPADLDGGNHGGTALLSVFGDASYQENNAGAIQITHADGNLSAVFHPVEVKENETPGGGRRVEIICTDPCYPVTLTLVFETCPDSDVLSACSRLSHQESGPVRIRNLPAFYVPLHAFSGSKYLTHFPSAWAWEMQMIEEPLAPGEKRLAVSRGASNAFGANPSFILSLDGPAHETSGPVIGGSLAAVSGWYLRFRTDFRNNTVLDAGENLWAGDYVLDPGIVFETPKLLLCYSGEGTGQLSRQFHRWARSGGLRDGDRPREVLLNSWEGVYFDIAQHSIVRMIHDAADLGAELFVLDDGWFGEKYPRNAANAGLGDWNVDLKKLPGGLQPLMNACRQRNLKFGIWVEPEMVNPKSELYEKHPDWIVRLPNREPATSRNQYILDLSNPEVVRFITGMMDDLLSSNPGIGYIKWDCNRDVQDPGSAAQSAEKQANFPHDAARNLNAIFAGLAQKHPHVQLQTCASGGGRVTYGFLSHSHEFWASDNTDALQRLFIQWGTSQFYPAIATDANVSAVPNHQTGRSLPLKFRCDVAMSAKLGIQLDPAELTADEKKQCAEAVDLYKTRLRDVVQLGDLYRLISPYGGAYASLMYAMPDGSRAAVFAYRIRNFRGEKENPGLFLQGLDPDALYRVEEVNTAGGVTHSGLNGRTAYGDTLMRAGLPVHLKGEYDSAVWILTRQ